MQAPEVTGGLDKSVVRRVVRRHLAELRYCYGTIGLTDKPELAGLVKVIWTVAATGRVLKVSISQSELNHSRTEACIKHAVRRWRFPKPTNSLPFITYPFLFKPKAP